ncbi:MAG: hypothetical protein AB8B75_14865 [Roseobacter sp.]
MDLNAQLLAAHEADDTRALARLYAQAAEVATNDDGRGFFLTHALVFALEAGAPEASALRQELIEMGREMPV